jgi:PPOX class probable F420-dependent enzyme
VIRLNPEQLVFVTERHLATLTTLRPVGTPHVVPVAFTWDVDAGLARITTNRKSFKARHAVPLPDGGDPRAALCQVAGGRWITLEGTIALSEDEAEIADAVARYARRYRPLEPNPDRVVLRVTIDKVMSSTYMAS